MVAPDAPELGAGLPLTRMPAHWMLGRLGKRVMRPGGLAPSLEMLASLAIGPDDDVVELWPGLGITTGHAIRPGPRSYVGIERGEAEAARARQFLTGPSRRCNVAPAHRTGLADAAASVVFGEALLTLEPASRKRAIVAEAARLLRPGGRYGVHELLLRPDTLTEAAKDDIERTLTRVLKVGARPLTRPEWEQLLVDGGFQPTYLGTGGLLLLEPVSFVKDEGVGGTLRFLGNTLRNPSVIPRLAEIWRTFGRYADNLGSIVITARYPGPDS